jgi:hypothetical protein
MAGACAHYRQPGGIRNGGPFSSWAARISLTRRRRGNSILAALVCFLVHSHDEGTLEEMGLKPSEDLLDSTMDVTEAEAWHGQSLGGRIGTLAP